MYSLLIVVLQYCRNNNKWIHHNDCHANTQYQLPRYVRLLVSGYISFSFVFNPNTSVFIKFSRKLIFLYILYCT